MPLTGDKYAVADDGALIRYSVRGSGSIRFALSHSLAMSSAFWDPVTNELGTGVSVLTWDCRGHGLSSKPAGPYSVEQFADDLAAVLNAAGWEKAISAGASMGGTVTLAFAARHPARVSALGLIDTTASYGEGAPQLWEERAQKAQQDGLSSLTAFQQTRWFSDAFREAHADTVKRCIDTFCANDPVAYGETCRMLGKADLTSALSTFSVPTSILVGEEDYATPLSMAQNMHEKISGSTLEIIPRARHLTPLECPGLIADRLLALAGRVQA